MRTRNRALAEGGEIVVDARGHRCPTPTLRLARAARQGPAGAIIRLIADDPLARIDVPHFAAHAGLELIDVLETGSGVEFTLRIGNRPSRVKA